MRGQCGNDGERSIGEGHSILFDAPKDARKNFRRFAPLLVLRDTRDHALQVHKKHFKCSESNIVGLILHVQHLALGPAVRTLPMSDYKSCPVHIMEK